MEAQYYREMQENCGKLERSGILGHRRIFLFGHCNATEELAGLLMEKGYAVTAILDNSKEKQGRTYRGIPIVPPEAVLSDGRDKGEDREDLVCIATRFYEAMHAQLVSLGFAGEVRKLVDYNTYAEYSLSEEMIGRKRKRAEYGKSLVEALERKHPGHFRIFCPFSALGDVYFCMSYLPHFLQKRGRERYVVCVAGQACGEAASLFDSCPVEVMQQKDLDAAIQAEMYMQDEDFFIAHQDRPYVVNLHKALPQKKIPLEKIYCCGVFGLPKETVPAVPTRWNRYAGLEKIREGRAVILSPYAKSVAALPAKIWQDLVSDYKEQGYQVFTNAAGDEMPLAGTESISPAIREMKSVVERAGTFIGIRSGICDVIRTANCRKIALYPDYNYCGMQWKAIDMYAIDGFENITAAENFAFGSPRGDR